MRWSRRLWSALPSLIALGIGVCGSLPCRAEETALVHGITHGSEITKIAVGPVAASYKPDDSKPAFEGGEIKAGLVPNYARLIADAASYDGLYVPGPHLLIENVTI